MKLILLLIFAQDSGSASKSAVRQIAAYINSHYRTAVEASRPRPRGS